MEVSFEKPLEASLFCLENSSTDPPMKQTCGDKGVTLLAARAGVVAPLLAHVSGAVLARVMLFVNGRGALPAQHREKLQGDNLNLHFSRENFEGLEQSREFLSHDMRVTIFRYNNKYSQNNIGWKSLQLNVVKSLSWLIIWVRYRL